MATRRSSATVCAVRAGGSAHGFNVIILAGAAAAWLSSVLTTAPGNSGCGSPTRSSWDTNGGDGCSCTDSVGSTYDVERFKLLLCLMRTSGGGHW